MRTQYIDLFSRYLTFPHQYTYKPLLAFFSSSVPYTSSDYASIRESEGSNQFPFHVIIDYCMRIACLSVQRVWLHACLIRALFACLAAEASLRRIEKDSHGVESLFLMPLIRFSALSVALFPGTPSWTGIHRILISMPSSCPNFWS
jgi:hypothetical protein